MNIPYFELLNPIGFKVESIGRVHSPKLRDICDKGYREYQYSLSLMIMTPKEYFESIMKYSGLKENPYDLMTDDQKRKINMFDIFVENSSTRESIRLALSFFIEGNIEWEQSCKAFLVNPSKEKDSITADGVINSENWLQVCDVCLKCAYIDSPKVQRPKKYRDERTRKKFEEFYKKKEEFEKNKRANKKENPDYELANIISSLATYHQSLNMSNIWDLTVYQIHDTFNRQRMKQQIDISDRNYSVWGGKDHKTDMWFEHMS